jgi:Rrf2 family transcriptional regulator, nitric oxide-sensitive transcriptional repressor
LEPCKNVQLTRHTDFALRTLIYLGRNPDHTYAISEIAPAIGAPQNHLTKVTHNLVKAGYLVGIRGRYGGLMLSRPAIDINIGEVVRRMEPHFDIADCGTCQIAGGCRLRGVFGEALLAFFEVLDRYNLAQLLTYHTGAVSPFAGLLAADMAGSDYSCKSPR